VARRIRATFSGVTLDIREATTEDVDAVIAFWGRAAGPTALVDRADDITRLLQTGSAALLLAEEEGRLLGTIIAGWDGWRGNLYRMAVEPDVRQQGIATRLVGAAEAALKERGCQRVTALVHLELGDAAPFWKKVGYGHDTEVGRFVRNLE
jgi:GNAT superfamily N-acetyltransferase